MATDINNCRLCKGCQADISNLSRRFKFCATCREEARKPKGCAVCGLVDKLYSGGVCWSCRVSRELYFAHGSGRIAAHVEVKRAIKKGKLARPAEFLCVDCGAPAQYYEHRDYNKPLDVVPICQVCNARRGSAKPKDWNFEEMMDYLNELPPRTKGKFSSANLEALEHYWKKYHPN